jgi:hypothetical protein
MSDSLDSHRSYCEIVSHSQSYTLHNTNVLSTKDCGTRMGWVVIRGDWAGHIEIDPLRKSVRPSRALSSTGRPSAAVRRAC